MANTRILCVFTTLLGHKTAIRKVMDVLDRLPGLEPTYLVLGAGDYAQYPVPWWARATNPWEAQFIARRKARPFRERQFDLLFVNAWELTVAFRIRRTTQALCRSHNERQAQNVRDDPPNSENNMIGAWPRNASRPR